MGRDPMTVKQRIGARVREARLRLALEPEQLAASAGFADSQLVSEIEHGTREIKAWELARLAKELRVSLHDLLSEGLPESPPILWRKEPEHPKATEAVLLERCRQYRDLEEATEQIREVPLPSIGEPSNQLTYGRVAAHADGVRQQLQLGPKPATTLLDALEDTYGVKVWFEELGQSGAASSTIGSFGPAVLINASEPRWRRNFSLAHELFHLLTWESLPAHRLKAERGLMDRAETLANAFAAALLLPVDALRTELVSRTKEDKIAIQELIDVARQFQVSTDALLWRAVDLGWFQREPVNTLLGNPAVQRLDSTTRRQDWDRPLIPPQRFVRLAHLAYTRGLISRAKLRSLLDVAADELEELLARYGLSDAPELDAELTATHPM